MHLKIHYTHIVCDIITPGTSTVAKFKTELNFEIFQISERLKQSVVNALICQSLYSHPITLLNV